MFLWRNHRPPSAGGGRASEGGDGAAPVSPWGRRWWRAAIVLLPAIFLGQGAWFIAANSQTYDEALKLCAGCSYWATGNFRFNPEHPPLMKELCCAADLVVVPAAASG